MATQVQLRRGTTAENDAFTGAQAEVTVDLTKDNLRVHDGSTQGGFEIAKADSQTHTNVDINSGSIDGTTIGGSTPAAITGTTVTATGLVTAQDGLVVDNDGATVATFDRATSDGTIVDLQKDGSSVGEIGHWFRLYIGQGDTGIRFRDDTDAIVPMNVTGLANRDAAIDLGDSATRFKDLYLSGGVYLGGTGAANYLDDYEEGTWTPVFDSGTGGFNGSALSASHANYVKIGRLVHLSAEIAVTGGSNLSADDYLRLTAGSVPFSAVDPNMFLGVATTNNVISTGNAATHIVGSNVNEQIVIICQTIRGTVSASIANTSISITYQTA